MDDDLDLYFTYDRDEKRYLQRKFYIYSFDHKKIEILDNNCYYNIGFLCSIKDDRLKILIKNIINWIERGFHCYLFFSNTNDYYIINNFINNINKNTEISNNIEKIKYVIYKFPIILEDSSGMARISVILFFNNFFKEKNKKSIFVISDDRRLTKFSNFNKMFEESKNDNQILFPKSERSYITGKRKCLKKKSKIYTTYHSTKLGQVYIMNHQTIQRISCDEKILTCMSAPIFEDYILLYLDINIKISKFCYRMNYHYQESISRKIITKKEIFKLLNSNNSKGYFLNIVLKIITKNDMKLYYGKGYELHKKILQYYLL
jgi:hypothetical protein